MDYGDFLKQKKFRQVAYGKQADPADVHPLLFPFQVDVTTWAVRKGRCAVFLDTGLGKAQPVSEPVLTPSGWRPIGDLVVGDIAIGGDGHPTPVVGIHPQGKRLVASVEFNDGARTECDFEHLWSVTTDLQASRGKPWRTMTTWEIADSLRQPTDNRLRWRIPMASVQIPGAILPIDPYVLGILIGDGCLTGSLTIPTFTTTDREIVDHVNKRVQSPFAARDATYSDRAPTYRIIRLKGKGTGSSPSAILEALRSLGLWGCYAATKFIPPAYLLASESQRLDLLRGLMDSDGWTGSATQFTTISKKLALDVQGLVRSLGGVARRTSKIPIFRDSEGVRKKGSRAYNITIKLPIGVNPFLLSRKAKKYSEIKRTAPVRKIKSIAPIADKEVICIQVAAPHQTYVTRDYIVTHNTLVQLEWARLLDENTLIVAPLSVARQTVREGRKIDLDVRYVRSQEEANGSKLWITNYEMVGAFDLSQFGAVILDESSILKSIGGKTRRKLTNMCADVPYRLCCTATPAPNDYVELGNHAEFLGICSRAEMLAMFFINANKEHTFYINDVAYRKKGSNKAGTEWRLKHHAEEPFFRWLASWGIVMTKPSDLGYDDDGFILPPLNIETHFVNGGDYRPDDQLFFTHIKGVGHHAEIRRETLPQRLDKLVELVDGKDNDQWVIWCGLNEEQELVSEAFGDECVSIYGALSLDEKIGRLDSWLSGEKQILISKPRVLGWGLNLQQAHKMAFFGLSHSFEQYYQCIRREWRYLQEYPVDVHIILSELEDSVYHNIMRKDAQARRLREEMIKQLERFEREELGMVAPLSDKYQERTVERPKWTAMLGDATERMGELGDASIDLSVYSPPFADLYTYTPSPRDLGNSRNWDEFFDHYKYIIREVLRVTKPGRVTCVHTSDIPALQQNDGYIGIKNFPGRVIAAYEREGWIFHGRIVISKNPQAQAIRTHSKGLLFVQLEKDSIWSRPALLDQVLVFRKDGDNQVPVTPVKNGEMDRDMWIKWAHGVWTDIRETDVLQHGYKHGRAHDDEKHVCPLQLPTIERCIKLYSNPGEVVLSMFGGIGSEGYIAVKHGRRAILIELKESYFEELLRNMHRAEVEGNGEDMFEWAGVGVENAILPSLATEQAGMKLSV